MRTKSVLIATQRLFTDVCGAAAAAAAGPPEQQCVHPALPQPAAVLTAAVVGPPAAAVAVYMLPLVRPAAAAAASSVPFVGPALLPGCTERQAGSQVQQRNTPTAAATLGDHHPSAPQTRGKCRCQIVEAREVGVQCKASCNMADRRQKQVSTLGCAVGIPRAEGGGASQQ